MDASGGVERQCEGRIESLLGSDTKKLLFRTSAVDGRPAQKDDRAAQNAVVLVVASRVARSECCRSVISRILPEQAAWLVPWRRLDLYARKQIISKTNAIFRSICSLH